MVKLASNDFGRIKLFAKQSEVLKMNEKALKNEIRELLEKNRVLKDQNKNDLEYVMDQELRVEREKFYRLKFNIESMDID